jgi:hypothetical protein
MIPRAAALLLLGAFGCTSTTQAQRGSPAAQDWLAHHTSSDVRAELATEHSPARTAVTIDARSPTDVRFVAPDARLVPLEQVQKVVVVRHGVGALEGAALGLGVGALFGLFYGVVRPLNAYDQSIDCTFTCTHADYAALGAIVFGTLGLVLGAPTGGVVGARDVLELR